MFSAFAALWHAFRVLLWLPFAVVGHAATFILLNAGVYVYYRDYWIGTFWLSIMVCGAAGAIAHSLRPPHRLPKAKGPPVRKAMRSPLAALLLKDKGQAPSLAHARRSLPKELRTLLAAPVATPPEAVTHGREVVKQLAAQGGRQAA